jgi:predicted HicB family RNase H-like nuclease
MEDKKNKLAGVFAAKPNTPLKVIVDANPEKAEPEKTQTVKINADLHRKLKFEALKRGKKLKDLIEETLGAILERE